MTRVVDRHPRERVRALCRITLEVVLLVIRQRPFLTSERDHDAPEMLEQPLDRTTEAKGLSRGTVILISNGEYANSRPLSGKQERRVSKRRSSTSELSRVRETVYAQHAHKLVPTIDSALALLEEGAGGSDNPSDFKWSRSTLHRVRTDLGFNFKRRPNHYDVDRKKRYIVKQRQRFMKNMRGFRADGRTMFYTD